MQKGRLMVGETDCTALIVKPIVQALVRADALPIDDRIKAVVAALTEALSEADLYLLHGKTIEALNESTLMAQAIIRMQGEELLRLAIDGVEVDPDFLGECETMQ